MGRISIARLLGGVAMLAIGLAAICRATPVWSHITYNLMIFLFFAGLLGAILRKGRRGSWIGFALFGWGYIFIGFFPYQSVIGNPYVLPYSLANLIFEAANPKPIKPVVVVPASISGTMSDLELQQKNDQAMEDFQTVSADYITRSRSSQEIGHWVFTITFAWLGALLGAWFSRTPVPTVSARLDPPVPG